MVHPVVLSPKISLFVVRRHPVFAEDGGDRRIPGVAPVRPRGQDGLPLRHSDGRAPRYARGSMQARVQTVTTYVVRSFNECAMSPE